MLARRGFSPAQIAAAATGARRQGVTVADYLIGNGYVRADTLYRLIAEHLGLAFLAATIPLRENIDPHAAARQGLAPISDNHVREARIVVAPRGAALERLMSHAHPAERLEAPLALTTPDRLENALRIHAGARIAAEAAELLGDFDASLSVRHGPTARETSIALAGLAAFGALAFTFPLVAGSCIALAFFSAVLLRLFCVAMSVGPSEANSPLADADLPVYTIIVGLYREEAIVTQLLSALEELDYPHAKLDTKIVVEEDDLETIAALRGARRRFPFEIVIAPAGSPRTKPRALNVALPFARGALTCVFDAEDKPEKSQLRRAAEMFHESTPNLGCLQARLVVDNYADNWLTRLYALDYATLFEVIVPGLARLSLPIPLGGTSNHFRTAALRRVSGWDAWNVTEDADLGLRLARFGYPVSTLNSETFEEVPAAIPAFLRQRTRWIKGWMQTLFINARNPRRLIRELGFVSAACTLIGLGSAILGALFWPVFGLLLLWNLALQALPVPQSTAEFVHSTLWCFNAFFGAFAVFGAIAIGMKRQKLGMLWPWLILWPAYQALITIAAWRAVLELWRDPFGWAKTEHGLARSCRSRSHL